MSLKVLVAAAGALAVWAMTAFGSARAGPLDDELSQVFSTTAGDTYTITFELAHDTTDDENDFSVEFGGSTIYSLVNADAFPYTLVTLTATATSSSTTLAFLGREVPGWYDLDDVSVSTASGANLVANPGFDLDSPPPGTAPLDWTLTPAVEGSDFFVGPGPTYGAFSDPNSANFGAVGVTVPEPSTWAMMLLGFAGLGVVGYRRARTSISAV
jgi:PEP-CTERM motif